MYDATQILSLIDSSYKKQNLVSKTRFLYLKKNIFEEEQRKTDLKKNRGRIDLKRNDLKLQRTEEEQRDDLVDWTIERWVS